VFGAVTVGLAAYGLSQLRGGPNSAVAQAQALSSGGLPESGGGDSPSTTSAALSEEHQRERQALAAGEWPADPFWRPDQPEPAEPVQADPGAPAENTPLKLTAVINGPAPLAMINGRVVAVGDHVLDGVVVTAIGDNWVTLQVPDGEKTLTLLE
jgi:hypothetical protein